jgi:hypothetical protein
MSTRTERASDPADFDPAYDYAARDERNWTKLERYKAESGLSDREMLVNWPAYVRRRELPRFLAHYELFKQVIDLPGSILELGVYKGASFFTWTKLMETFCPGDRQRKVYGFDHFQGLVDFTEADGHEVGGKVDKVQGGWKATAEHARLLVDLHNSDSFLPGVDRCVLVEGDIFETLPRFLEQTPGLRISLLHFDVDLYKPTKFALDLLYPLVLKGGVVCFDEYAFVPWEGESRAVDEFFADTPLDQRPVIKKFPFSPTPSGYFIK